jgi:hypothetical protein
MFWIDGGEDEHYAQWTKQLQTTEDSQVHILQFRRTTLLASKWRIITEFMKQNWLRSPPHMLPFTP